MKVFVYGTLMDREPNNFLLGDDAVWLGKGETKPIYTLYDLKYFPALAFGGDTSVKGEVYEVSEKSLNKLDQLEGYEPKSPGKGFYNRQLILVRLKDRDIAALTYFLDEAPTNVQGRVRPIIPSGDWRIAVKGEYMDEPLDNKKGKPGL